MGNKKPGFYFLSRTDATSPFLISRGLDKGGAMMDKTEALSASKLSIYFQEHGDDAWVFFFCLLECLAVFQV
jgi:hypothetical protein